MIGVDIKTLWQVWRLEMPKTLNPTGTGLTQNRWAGINDLENDSCRLNYMNDQ